MGTGLEVTGVSSDVVPRKGREGFRNPVEVVEVIRFETHLSLGMKVGVQACEKFLTQQTMLGMALLGPGVRKVDVQDIECARLEVVVKKLPTLPEQKRVRLLISLELFGGKSDALETQFKSEKGIFRKMGRPLAEVASGPAADFEVDTLNRFRFWLPECLELLWSWIGQQQFGIVVNFSQIGVILDQAVKSYRIGFS